MNAVVDQTLIFDRSSLNIVRAEIRRTLGNDDVNDFHKESKSLDILTITLVPATILIIAITLGELEFGLYWLVLFIMQGILAQTMMLVSHDLFVHRKVGGDTLSWIGSIILTVPRLSIPSGYENAHLNHHKYIGSVKDTEAYKQDLNTRWKRLLFTSFLGVKMAQANKFNNDTRKHYHSVDETNTIKLSRERKEKTMVKIWLGGLVLGCFFSPGTIILGYLLPFIIILPVLNSLRIIIEHADANPDNPFNLSTFYKTGLITRPLFLWDSGDCHVVHHIFPRIPWYRMGSAVDRISPILEQHGAVKRTSFWWLIKGWYINNYPHRSLWPQSS